jgi:hypothetical protein
MELPGSGTRGVTPKAISGATVRDLASLRLVPAPLTLSRLAVTP